MKNMDYGTINDLIGSTPSIPQRVAYEFPDVVTETFHVF